MEQDVSRVFKGDIQVLSRCSQSQVLRHLIQIVSYSGPHPPSMAKAEYSSLETESLDGNGFGYTSNRRNWLSLKYINLQWLTAALAFCAGILATLAVLKIQGNMEKHGIKLLGQSCS
jgi:hypothetical protein